MLVIARFYGSTEQAAAAVNEATEAGFRADTIVLLTPPAEPDEFGQGGKSVTAEDVANAMRAGGMLGEHAEFYAERLDQGHSLVVMAPPIIGSGQAERILDAHSPLDVSHVAKPEPFVPLSDRAAPFSHLLGWPTLTEGTPFSDLLGMETLTDERSHISRLIPELADGFTLSGLFGMSTSTSSETPLSSMLRMPTKSGRLEGKASSFGIPLLTRSETPFSSMLGLRTKSKRDHYLYD
ncbi:MAG: hypothetical protein AAF991_05210 [Pseudomonadota bacterium]